MGRLERRLETLEEEARQKWPAGDVLVVEKQEWLARRRRERNEAASEDTRRARRLIRLFRVQGILPRMSADELIERILSWQPVPEGGRSREAVEREVALTIYNKEEGTEAMVCPDKWRESFAAGDELRERYDARPEEVIAEGYVRLGRLDEEGNVESMAEWRDCYEEGYGITEELVRRAVGLDIDEITDEERNRRLHEYLSDAMYGERGWRISQHMRRLAEGSER
jgi:hypothetical protein